MFLETHRRTLKEPPTHQPITKTIVVRFVAAVCVWRLAAARFHGNFIRQKQRVNQAVGPNLETRRVASWRACLFDALYMRSKNGCVLASHGMRLMTFIETMN